MVSLGSAGRFNSSQRGICPLPSLLLLSIPTPKSQHPHLLAVICFFSSRPCIPLSTCLGAKSLAFVLHHHQMRVGRKRKTERRWCACMCVRMRVQKESHESRRKYTSSGFELIPLIILQKSGLWHSCYCFMILIKEWYAERRWRRQQERWRKIINAEAHKVIKSIDGQALKVIISRSW